VFVVSEDEMYACGEGKSLLSGSVKGWSEVLIHDMALRAVAKWKGDVWVGAGGDLGLCKLEGRQLVYVKPNIKALCLDARENLLATASGLIADTTDGAKFSGRRIELFEDAMATTPPEWKR
jgi:hypothetical protein